MANPTPPAPRALDRALTFRSDAVALTATFGLAAASWVLALRAMHGMGMAGGSGLGSFPSFMVWWVPMMAAMMLPGAAPAIRRHACASGRLSTGPLFVGSYLAVWALVGVAVHAVSVVSAVYQPDRPITLGVVAIVAGGYELTPLKRYFRRRCHESVRSGFEYGLYCVGSSIGLMLLMALGLMGVLWMSVLAVLTLGQKLLPAKPVLDVPVALALIGLGLSQLPL